MAPGTDPSLVKPTSSVVRDIQATANPTPSDHMIAAAYHTYKATAKDKATAAVTTAAAAHSSSRSEAASRLTVSGFTNFDPDTRMSAMEPAQRDRLERAMRHTEPHWRQQRTTQPTTQEQRALHPRVTRLLDTQRQHLFAVLEIDHELRGIMLSQNAESSG